ncbi:hydrogenase maturation protease [Desulforamulus ruminis]|uniref:Hydrogenase maturation protease n=1 Tax=Desulforamulus ruminis (strain ATCC 23193 / DSM 2154 / NCIMB 8452 / DL) TaxID=696281 RepID=F6DVF1_DESRL|nr:hydrogenase maturation protease [Desulforamulus ruminis]AEG60304.1 hydrogenase maturation protease [Desulforamulus ruminis DSM 2154]
MKSLYLGWGNPLLGDDGIGVLIAEELGKLEWPHEVRIIEVGTSIFNFLQEVSPVRQVIVIDAFRAESPPGCVYRLDTEDVMDYLEQNAHDMSLPTIIKWARGITGLPEGLIIYGVEPQQLDFGKGLSVGLKAIVSKIITEIKTEV